MAITRLGGANAITGTIPTSVAPGQGKVLQIVQTAFTGTTETTTSTSYVNTSLAVTITPKYANSKLFFSVSGVFWWNTATQTSGEYFMARIVDSRTGASIMPQGGSHH